jgi:hypothetical protein
VLVLGHLLGELDLLLLLRALECGDVVEQVFVLLVHSPAALRWTSFCSTNDPNQEAKARAGKALNRCPVFSEFQTWLFRRLAEF